MAQDHLALLRAPHRGAPLELRASRTRLERQRERSRRQVETHVVVATQNLPRMSNSIAALMMAGFMVTAYASPTRLLPRLHRMGGNPVRLLVIDGGLAPAFARAAAIAARATYADLPILLLAPADAAQRADFMPMDVVVMRLPVSETQLVDAALALARGDEPAADEPPDAA